MLFLSVIIFFVFGTILGSFLNACIYRFPRNISLVKPKRSICPQCKKQLRWYQLVPLISYIFLRGKCAYCRKPIFIRYFMVELLSGCLFAMIPFLAHPAVNVLLVFEMILLIGIFFTDIETQIIPDEFTITGFVLGLVYSLIIGGMMGLREALFGAALAGGVFWVIALIGKLVYKKEALGDGDVRLVMMLGSFLWPLQTLAMLYLSFFLGSLIAVVLLITRKKTRHDYIPFGPAIVLSGVIILVWGEHFLKLMFPAL